MSDEMICQMCCRAIYEDVPPGYIGPKNREDKGCYPFMEFVVLCLECANEGEDSDPS